MTVEVFDFNNMSSLDALNDKKPNFRGRGRGRGGPTRGIPRGGPPLPVNPHFYREFVPGATNGSHNTRRRHAPGALPVFDANYPDPYTYSHHNPSPALRSKGGGLGFGDKPGPHSKPVGNGRSPWDPATNPLLQPIKFVRATERLFEADPDELLQAHELKPHPSQCLCVLSSSYLCQAGDELDPQVEIMEGIIAHNEQTPNGVSPSSEGEAKVEETIIETAVRVEMGISKRCESPKGTRNVVEGAAYGLRAAAVDRGSVVPIPHPETEFRIENSELFYFHSAPQVLPVPSSDMLFDRATELAIGESHTGEQEDDEIILVPNRTRSRTIPSPPSVVPSVVIREETVSVVKAPTPSNDTSINIPTSFSIGNPSTRSTFVPMRMRKEAKRTKRIERNKQKATRSNFFDREEMLITGDAEESIGGSPRVGDSDLEWGSDGPPQGVKDGIFVEKADISESEDGGMDVDDGLDEAALARFAMSVTNAQHLGIHDLEGAEESDEEDEVVVGSSAGGSDLSTSESSEDSDEWTDEDENNQTPDVQWRTKLTKMREKVKGKRRATAADRQEDFVAYLEVSTAHTTRGLTILIVTLGAIR